MLPCLLPKFFLITLVSTILSADIFTYSYSQCLDDQKSLLLELIKNELVFDHSISRKLVQWNQTDECCSWYGVECDAAGHVTSLQLDDEAISGGIGDMSSLFKLEYLEKLNLAYNDLNGTQIPRGIQNLTYLTHLNLSDAFFSGQVPLEVSFLWRLVSLDISSHASRYKASIIWRNDYILKLEYPNLEMLVHNLSGLRELYLDRVDISSQKSQWSRIISSYLPNLTSLSLRYCSVSGPLDSLLQLKSLSILQLDQSDLSTVAPDFFENFSSLTTLSLLNCSLNGSFPKTILQRTTLQSLDLTYNPLLGGSLPLFPQNGSLQSLVLIQTNFSGSIPISVGNLKNLSEMDLSSCNFTGPIPSTFANLTELVFVDLSDNFFTGSLSTTIFRGFSNLVSLNLWSNSFTGNIPQSLFGLPSLMTLTLSHNKFNGQLEEFHVVNASDNIVYLDLSRNRLEGPIPYSLLQLPNVTYLDLSNNLFNGTIHLEKIQSLPNLVFLILSYNKLSVDTDIINSSSSYPLLRELGLASCNLYSIPDFIRHTNMAILDLSNNQISGAIPSWLWGVGRQFYSMNLSSNLLTGFEKPFQIHALFNDIDLSSNQLQGELNLPISKLEAPFLDQTSFLFFLSVANNNLRGSIPTSLCNATSLYLLDLSLNQFSGDVPPCLLQNIQNLEVFNLGNNNISGNIPDVNSSLICKLRTFELQNNSFQGEIPKSLESCMSLELVNVGNNIIHDSFPCMLPPSLRVLVLRSNRFYGEVRCQRSWPNLQIVDISSNNFTGRLESMNFSSWRAMVLESDAKLRYNRSSSTYLQASNFYYPVGLRITLKGLEVELVKIWPDFVAVDFSCNNFQGDQIPNSIGNLTALYLLNLSHNALNGSIPKSIGKLKGLGSLDLSKNHLEGMIPMELAGLTFLSFLNLSYNKLIGKIPSGSQLQTFSEASFEGNTGRCGPPVNRSCSDDNSQSEHQSEESHAHKEIEWKYVTGAFGYVVGLGSFLWVLLYCQNFRDRYFEQLDEVFYKMFNRGP